MRFFTYILILVTMLQSFDVQGQSYSIDFIDVNLNPGCGQTTTNYGDDFDVEVIQVGNSPRGYRVIEIGQATEDGNPCSFTSSFTENKTSTQSLCETFSDGAGGCCDSWDFDFIIIPDYNILTPNPGANNSLSEITLSMTPGYDPLVYKWQFYHPTTNQWTSFPAAFVGQSTITFDAEDLFGANAANFYGVSIQYRIALCNGWIPSGFPYIYNFIKESPQVTDVIEMDTRCDYTQDGQFTVIFNRPLDTGEQLTSLSLRWAGGDNALDTSDDVATYQFEPTATYTGTQFTWPQSVRAGKYRLTYQSDGANSAASYDPIIIEKGPRLAYTITTNDISCFNTNDGEIIITVDPSNLGNTGNNPNYYYTVNGGTPVTFNGTTTMINGLGPGTRVVKVFDFNDCTERE